MENLAIANKGRSIRFLSAEDFSSERDGSGAFRAWLLAAHLYDLERDRDPHYLAGNCRESLSPILETERRITSGRNSWKRDRSFVSQSSKLSG